MLLPAYGLSWLEFDTERDTKVYKVWLCDLVHGVPPYKPLYLGTHWTGSLRWGLLHAAETLHLPTTKGWDYRVVDGYLYPTVTETTEEEARMREPIFREKLRPYLEDFDKVWEPLKAEITALYANLKERYGARKYEDIQGLENIELAGMFEDFVRVVSKREGEIHMIMMVPAYYIFGLFQNMWQELFGTPANIDPLFSRLMTGFDSAVFRVNREIWRLGTRAIELGLGQLFQTIDDSEEILAQLEKSNAGMQWVREYHEFLEVHGWRCERMLDWATPTWIEKPSLGIPSIKIAVISGGSFTLDEKREQAVKEREKAEKEVLAKVPLEQREWFSVLMRCAQKSCYWSEDHTPYLDMYAQAVGRWITRELGRRFAQAGCIDDPEDIYFLVPEDIRKAYVVMGNVNLRPYVERRKKEWEENLKKEPKPFIGDPEKAGEILMKDPTLSVSVQAPIVRPELKADLYGAAAAPGIIEGIARVIMSEKQLGEVQPGEILVSPGTSAAWTPVFEIVSGVITDGGGGTSHPVIVAREYGIPCVSGCIEATKKIKTGQKVRVDGNLGIVYILG